MAASETLGGAFVELVLKTGQFTNELNKVRKLVQSFSVFAAETIVAGAAKSIGKALTIGVTVPLAALAFQTTKAAARIEASNALIAREFGKGAAAAKEWAAEIAAATGRTAVDIGDAAGKFQLLFVNMGFAREEAQKLSTRMTEIGLDQAAVRGKRTTNVLGALQSALVGNAGAVRALGIETTITALDEFLLSKGIALTTKELNAQQKALVIMAKTLTDSQDLIGGAREGFFQLGNLLTNLKSRFIDLVGAIGVFFAPVVKVVAFVGSVALKAFTAFVNVLNKLPFGLNLIAAGFVVFIASLGPLLFALASVVVVVGKVVFAYKVLQFAGLATAATQHVVAAATFLASKAMLVFSFATKKALLAIPLIGAALLAVGLLLEWIAGKFTDTGHEMADVTGEVDDLLKGLTKLDDKAKGMTGLKTLGSIGTGLFQSGRLPGLAAPGVGITQGVTALAAAATPASVQPAGIHTGGRPGSAMERIGQQTLQVLRSIEVNTSDLGLA